MTNEQALQIIDQVLADFRGTRKDHETILSAFLLIKKEINKTVDKKSK